MTVLNTSYSTIDEAWGDPYSCSPPSHKQEQDQQKKKKKRSSPPQPSPNPSKDPICELYAMGDTHYNDSDIISYANKYYQKQNSKPTQQRSRITQANREHPRQIDIKDDQFGAVNSYIEHGDQSRYNEQTDKNDDAGYEEEEGFLQEEPQHSQQQRTIEKYYDQDDDYAPYYENNRRRRLYDEHDYVMSAHDPDARDNSFQWMDIILYVFSGLILIFMMEQFVKIGVLMQ